MKFLITAGPTREAIDPVRYLSNRSSGKMGYALAAAAAEAGHDVILISGPTALSLPEGVESVSVVSAGDMYSAVENTIGVVDVAIFAAAVADYRPARVADQKIKKSEDRLVLELEKTQDILGSVRSKFGFKGLLVGFAAETQDLMQNAAGKLAAKGCDLLVANDVSQPDIGFDSDDNAIVFCYPNDQKRVLDKAPKRELAVQIIAECQRLIGESKNDE